MAGIEEKLGYYVLTSTGTTTATVKSGPAGLYGIIPTATTLTDLSIYDGLTATGALVYKGIPVMGTPIHFGGKGVALKNGLTAVGTGANGTAVLLYI